MALIWSDEAEIIRPSSTCGCVRLGRSTRGGRPRCENFPLWAQRPKASCALLESFSTRGTTMFLTVLDLCAMTSWGSSSPCPPCDQSAAGVDAPYIPCDASNRAIPATKETRLATINALGSAVIKAVLCDVDGFQANRGRCALPSPQRSCQVTTSIRKLPRRNDLYHFRHFLARRCWRHMMAAMTKSHLPTTVYEWKKASAPAG